VKAIRVSVAVAVVLSFVTLSVTAGLFNIRVQVKRYNAGGLARESNGDFISNCTDTNGAKLVAVVDDLNSNIAAIATVDQCGNVLCTNLTVTSNCSQVGSNYNGTAVGVAGLTFSSSQLNGTGFFALHGSVNRTNPTEIASLHGKGEVVLCDTNGDVLAGTVFVTGRFKPRRNCDH